LEHRRLDDGNRFAPVELGAAVVAGLLAAPLLVGATWRALPAAAGALVAGVGAVAANTPRARTPECRQPTDARILQELPPIEVRTIV